VRHAVEDGGQAARGLFRLATCAVSDIYHHSAWDDLHDAKGPDFEPRLRGVLIRL
jgi:hypothetical protein